MFQCILFYFECIKQVKTQELLQNDPDFMVPSVIPDLSTMKILTTEFVSGVAIDQAFLLPQEERDKLARKILKLTLNELFVFRFMQTDPNFSNFLYPEQNEVLIRPKSISFVFISFISMCCCAILAFQINSGDRKLRLIDFGASRGFSVEFVSNYLDLVLACANRDTQGVLAASRALGLLTGERVT
jgi:aarF domain-containing kinase